MKRKRRELPRLAGGAEGLAAILDDLDTKLAALDAGTKSTDAAAASTGTEGEPAATGDAANGDGPGTDLTKRAADLEAKETALATAEQSLAEKAAQLNALTDALTKQREASRFAGVNIQEEIAKALAAGGKAGGLTVTDPASLQAGAHKGVAELKESKSLMRFMQSMNAMGKGWATEAQREFMMEHKALAEGTGSAGGYMVPPDWMPDILQLFRGVTVVRAAGPRIIPFGSQMNQVQLSTGATAYYTAENAAITPSQETFSQVTLLTPKNLTGLVPVSNYLLNDTTRGDIDRDITASAEDLIRQDLSVVMALKEDKNFLMGNPGTETGSPTGITNISGIVSNPLNPTTNGFTPTLPQLRAIKNYTRRFSIPNPRWAWFFNPQFLSYVESLTDSLGRFLADTSILQVNNQRNDASTSGSIVGAGAGVSGVLDGLPFYCSNQIPVNLTQGSATNATWLLLVDMNQLIVGLNQQLVIDMSAEASYTPDGGTTWINAFQNSQTLFRGVLRHDINHLYPYTIVQQGGVLVS